MIGASGSRVQLVSVLVDDEFPVTADRMRCAEVLKVKGQHWQPVPLSERHDRGIGVSEREIRELRIELDGSPEQRRRAGQDRVLTGGEGIEKQPRGRAAHTRAQKLIDLDDDGFRHEQVPAKLRDQSGRQIVRAIAAIGRGNQRTSVRDDLQGV